MSNYLNNYFIKKGYKPNSNVSTLDEKSGENYWNEERIKASYFYQYYVYSWAKDIINKNKIKSVLDIGCGAASKLKLIYDDCEDVDITGIDQKSAIDYCKKARPFGNWIELDLESGGDINLAKKPGLVICCDVIEHVQNPDVVLEKIKGVVSEKTLIIISTPDRDRIRGAKAMNCPHRWHVREWSSKEFKKYMIANDFTILKDRWQLPAKFSLNRILLNEIYGAVRLCRNPYWNYVVLLKFKG